MRSIRVSERRCFESQVGRWAAAMRCRALVFKVL